MLWIGALVPTKRVDVLLHALVDAPEATVRLAGLGEPSRTCGARRTGWAWRTG